jgi:hypothetical protein
MRFLAPRTSSSNPVKEKDKRFHRMWNVMHKVIEFIQPRFALIYMIFQTPENGNFYHFQPHDAIWYQQQEREHDEDSRRIESDPRK